MKTTVILSLIVGGIIVILYPSSFSANALQNGTDPLPSWKDDTLKENIIAFVGNATDTANTQYFIPPESRIAVFDNDGTLWSEKPLYFQAYFSFDRVPEVVANNQELKDTFPFNAILEKNFTALQNMTETDVMNLAMTTHANNYF